MHKWVFLSVGFISSISHGLQDGFFMDFLSIPDKKIYLQTVIFSFENEERKKKRERERGDAWK